MKEEDGLDWTIYMDTGMKFRTSKEIATAIGKRLEIQSSGNEWQMISNDNSLELIINLSHVLLISKLPNLDIVNK